MTLFRILLAVDIAIALVALGFFAVGLNDGSVSEFNIATWLGLLAGIAAVIGTGYAFHIRGQTGMASAVLGVVAAPGVLYAGFILLILVTQPNWR